MLMYFKKISKLIFIIFAFGILFVFSTLWYFSSDLPDYKILSNYKPPISSRVHSGEGQLIAEYALQKRLFIPYDSIPDKVIYSFLSSEDKNFFSHPGIDAKSITRAIIKNLKNYFSEKRLEGASTITQQVAKNFLLTNEVSFKRKIKEAILAFRIERAYSKKRIMELYLNQIYLGVGAYGIAAASLEYFDKSVNDLNYEEAALLAALPKAPSKYNPFKSIKKAKIRRDIVLKNLYDNSYIDNKEYEELKICCEKEGIEFLSSPFDESSASFLNDLMEVFKIASSEITNKPFIELICSYGKPVILSTGASNIEEIQEALGWIDRFGVPAAILHCVLSYPTADDSAQLGMIKDLKNQFPNRLVGYSDHTLPGNMKNLETATILGAEILEKHFTHDKTLPGNDHYHAMDQHDLARFMTLAETIHTLLGPTEHKEPIATETLSRKNARRSIVLARDVIAGHQLTADDLTYKRPGNGVSPLHWDEVLKCRTSYALHADHVLQWQDLVSPQV